jgi:DNA mismatch repair protein MutL
MVENILEENLSRNIEEQMDKCLVIMACHSVIRARQSLTHREIRQLLEQLDQCETPSHCPHGRPTWIKWDRKEMEKQFSRIV